MRKRPRTFTPEFKFQRVLEVVTGAKSPGQVCREHQIAESLFSRWRQQFLENGAKAFESPRSPTRDDAARIAELERVIGQLTLELAAAKKVSDWLDSLP